MSFSYHMLNFLRSTQCLLSLETGKQKFYVKTIDMLYNEITVYDNKNVCKVKTGKKKLLNNK